MRPNVRGRNDHRSVRCRPHDHGGIEHGTGSGRAVRREVSGLMCRLLRPVSVVRVHLFYSLGGISRDLLCYSCSGQGGITSNDSGGGLPTLLLLSLARWVRYLCGVPATR